MRRIVLGVHNCICGVLRKSNSIAIVILDDFEPREQSDGSMELIQLSEASIQVQGRHRGLNTAKNKLVMFGNARDAVLVPTAQLQSLEVTTNGMHLITSHILLLASDIASSRPRGSSPGSWAIWVR
jgi:hypothetical protein